MAGYKLETLGRLASPYLMGLISWILSDGGRTDARCRSAGLFRVEGGILCACDRHGWFLSFDYWNDHSNSPWTPGSSTGAEQDDGYGISTCDFGNTSKASCTNVNNLRGRGSEAISDCLDKRLCYLLVGVLPYDDPSAGRHPPGGDDKPSKGVISCSIVLC